MALQSTTAIATITLQQASSTVTFSGIPNTYRDLVLVVECSASLAQDVACNINGITSDASYSRVLASGDGSSRFSVTVAPRLITYYGTPASGLRSNHIVQFIDYSQTNKHKTYLTRSNRAGSGTDMVASRFASTDVITQIALSPAAGVFESGSTFSLYGRIA